MRSVVQCSEKCSTVQVSSAVHRVAQYAVELLRTHTHTDRDGQKEKLQLQTQSERTELKPEDRGQRTEDRRQRTEDRNMSLQKPFKERRSYGGSSCCYVLHHRPMQPCEIAHLSREFLSVAKLLAK